MARAKHVWDPLGMRDTYFMDAARIIKNRAGGYTLRDEQLVHAPYCEPED